MCFWSLVLIPDIKEYKRLPQRPDQPGNTVTREALSVNAREEQREIKRKREIFFMFINPKI